MGNNAFKEFQEMPIGKGSMEPLSEGTYEDAITKKQTEFTFKMTKFMKPEGELVDTETNEVIATGKTNWNGSKQMNFDANGTLTGYQVTKSQCCGRKGW